MVESESGDSKGKRQYASRRRLDPSDDPDADNRRKASTSKPVAMKQGKRGVELWQPK
jgi:hypothetical protein